jgi:hypothetical protein
MAQNGGMPNFAYGPPKGWVYKPDAETLDILRQKALQESTTTTTTSAPSNSDAGTAQSSPDSTAGTVQSDAASGPVSAPKLSQSSMRTKTVRAGGQARHSMPSSTTAGGSSTSTRAHTARKPLLL